MKRYYPCFMAIMGLLVLMISNGLAIAGLSASDEALWGGFGWERGPFKLRDLSTLLLAGLMASFVGMLIERVGPRVQAMVGAPMLVVLVASTRVRNERERLAGR